MQRISVHLRASVSLRTSFFHASILAMLLPLLAVPQSFGWGADGHRMINRTAMQMLPAEMPAFFRTPQAIDEVEYLGPEPDRWRSPAEPELSATQACEHYLDMELADMVEPNGLPSYRYDFLRDVYAAEIHHPRMAEQLTPQRIGLLPWQANEVFERLKSDLRDYRALLAAHKDTYGAEQAVLFDVGWLGHYVGDGSQPLHTTINYNGWVEENNPHGYTREHTIHSRFETEFVHNNIRQQDLAPLAPGTPRLLKMPFEDFVAYLQTSHQQVEEVYQLDKEGGFNGAGTAQSRTFVEERLAAAASMLRDMVYTAWVQSAQPVPDWHRPANKPSAMGAKHS